MSDAARSLGRTYAGIAALLLATGLTAATSTLAAPAATPRLQDAEKSTLNEGAKDAPKEAPKEAAKEKEEKLTLERLFPEKSFFGPSARSAAFSRDGRFCAFLYTPYAERRHGEDLYVLDTKSGQIRRITSVSRMAEFDAETRKVRDDREGKAKKAGVTLAQLASEQRESLGWTEGWHLGRWSGEATTTATPPMLAPGQTKLTLKEAADGAISGELQIGLARLPVRDGTFDATKKELTAKIKDDSLKLAGDLTLVLEKGADKESFRGSLSLKEGDKEPTQSLAITLSRAEPEPVDPKKRVPLGVVGAIGERLALGDVVNAEDATINDPKDGEDGEKKPPKDPAPRYSGISSYEWLPKRVGVDTAADDAAKAEMMLMFDGDIYRLTIDVAKWDAPVELVPTPPEPAKEEEGAKDESEKAEEAKAAEAKPEETTPEEAKPAEKNEDTKEKKPKKPARAKSKPVEPYRGDLVRLTRTRERESDVQYLPDGSGYTYLRSNALLRVTFGSHEIIQLDPELKDGERMVGYRISPDQKRLVFLATRGAPGPDGGGRTVTIVNYRDRFAKAMDVPRRMPDDPVPESYSSVYLYDLAKHQTEDGLLERVFTKRVSGPRDIIRVPEWSPDSSRVAFAAFEQSTGLVRILEAGFVPEKKDGDKKEGEKKGADGNDEKDEKKKEGEPQEAKNAEKQGDKKPDDKSEFKIENAKVVYQFLHHGGPNTPGMIAPLYLPDSRRMVFITELSGFRQLHMLDPRYEELSQLTQGKFEVYPFHQSADYTTLYYTSSEGDPAQDHVYALNLATRAVTKLTKDEGVFSRVAVRDDGSYLVASHVDFGVLGELVAVAHANTDQATTKRLTDSHPPEAAALTTVKPEYFTFENRHGQAIYGHMFKPKDWKPTDKRPLLIYVYGGPLGERNMAARGAFDGSSYFFARYMTEVHGYVTATIDPRGVSGYGALFEKSNFEQVGKPQTEDLVDGARWLAKNHGVDEKRMAMHGWSFGGFQTQMVMYTEPDVFAAGIAGAGPTEWHNYNAWYSTGTIGKNEPGKVDLEKYSLLPLAKKLKGKLLLVHGMEDSNVLYQDTVRVYRELLKAKKQTLVELFVDPTGGHGLGGDVKSFGRFSKYEEFLLRTIGAWQAPK